MDIAIKRALITVTDKSGLVPLALALRECGVEIISTGGTADFLAQHEIEVTPIEKISGSPEAFGGRMKSLSFNVASGILFRRDNEDDCQQALKLGIKAIDLVVCNLYAFEKKRREGLNFEQLIEHIDIGGPTLIRAAAKNYAHVAVATDPTQYPAIMEQLKKSATLKMDFRRQLAGAAFRLTAHYDQVISNVFEGGEIRLLRYGENPDQKASLHLQGKGLSQLRQLSGKEMSYNNYLDTDAAIKVILDLKKINTDDDMVVIVKHLNPCGVALGQDALACAWAGDPLSCFGGIVAIGGQCDQKMAQFLSQQFVEIVVASSFCPKALELLSKKKNLRLLEIDYSLLQEGPAIRSVLGGYLEQSPDCYQAEQMRLVTKAKMEASDLAAFGIVVTKHLKSNAVALVEDTADGMMLIGAGMGNPNRLVSVEQALNKAKLNGFSDLKKAILISDGFFPFADSIDFANEAGVTKVVQPGGSIRDQEVIDRCDQHGMAMLLTGKRHFNH